MMEKEVISMDQMFLKLDNFAKGVYMLEAKDKTHVIKKKMIVQ